MAHFLAPLFGLEMGLTSVRSVLALAKQSNYENILAIGIRVVLLGAFVSGLRKAYSWLSIWLDRYLYPTAYVAVTDTSYLWVMAWLAQDPIAQSQIKDFQLSTSEWRQVRQGSGNALRASGSSTAVGEHNSSWSAKDIIGQVIPAYHQGIRIKHGKNYIWVIRRMGYFARSNLRTVDHIQIRTLVWQKSALKDFLSAAHHRYFTKQDQELLIFHPKRINPTWQKPVSRPARPWTSVILPGTVKEDILSDVEKFLSEKEISWYAARGIPHRRGYLFKGAPGSGKTTLATAIASKLHLDIYVINPSQRGMDDAKLSKLFRDCPARSIILIEDIDCIFPTNRGRATLTVEIDEDEDATGANLAPADAADDPATAAPHTAGGHDLAPSTVTLSGLLNAIDGVSSQEGCVLIASTNHPEHLDPALRRAGRFDVQIPFYHATHQQASDLFKHFYPVEEPTEGSDEKKEIVTLTELDELASDFADAVFPQSTDVVERNQEDVSTTNAISMAALQGYLLGHKDEPLSAIQGAREWAAGHSEEKVSRKVIALTPVVAKKGKSHVIKKNATKAAPKLQLPSGAVDEDEKAED